MLGTVLAVIHVHWITTYHNIAIQCNKKLDMKAVRLKTLHVSMNPNFLAK